MIVPVEEVVGVESVEPGCSDTSQCARVRWGDLVGH
jgi:hypothetical protein